MGVGEGGGATFSSIILVGNWNFYDWRIEICKTNYCENKVKFNKDKSKNNEIKEII